MTPKDIGLIVGLLVVAFAAHRYSHSFYRAVALAIVLHMVLRFVLTAVGLSEYRVLRALVLGVTTRFFLAESFLFDNAKIEDAAAEAAADAAITVGRSMFFLPAAVIGVLSILVFDL